MDTNSLLAGGIVGLTIGLLIASFVSGLIIYFISSLGIGLKVKNYFWAMLSGIVIAIFSNISWNFVQSVMPNVSSNIVQSVVHLVVAAIVILIVGKLFQDKLEVNGFKGALGAATAIAIILLGINLFGGAQPVKTQSENSEEKEEQMEELTNKTNMEQSASLRSKLLTNMSLVLPGTEETISMNSDQAEYSQGYVQVGNYVAALPNGAVVTTLNLNSGGNAEDVYLAVFEPGEAAWILAQSTPLHDPSNVVVEELYTDMETIYITYYTYGAGQAQAEKPNQKNKGMYLYMDGKLMDTAEDTSMQPGADLAGTSWMWTKTEMNDDSVYESQNGEFIITFNADGSFGSTTDCNSMSGGYGYNSATGQITFSDIQQTLMACPNSQEDKYVFGLQSAERVAIEGNTMRIELKLDGGNMYFEKAQ